MDTRTIGNKLRKEKLGQNQKQSSQVTPLPFLHPPPIETATEGTCQDISGAPLKVLLSKVPHLQNAQSGCQAAASPLSHSLPPLLHVHTGHSCMWRACNNRVYLLQPGAYQVL